MFRLWLSTHNAGGRGVGVGRICDSPGLRSGADEMFCDVGLQRDLRGFKPVPTTGSGARRGLGLNA